VPVLLLNPTLTEGELARLLEKHRASLVVTHADLAERMRSHTHVPLRVHTHDVTLPAPLDVTELRGQPDSTSMLVLTSGTTGGTKACCILQRNVTATARATVQAYGIDDDSRYLTPLPLFHINANVIGVLAALTAGSVVVVGTRLPAAKLWAACARTGATALSTVPALVHDLLASDAQPPPHVRFAVCSSAALPSGTRERFAQRFGIPLLFSYGLSEAGCFVSYGQREAPVGSVGQPIGSTVRIVDDDDHDVPRGVRGEVLVQGPGVFAGYDADADATARTFSDGWLRTGDVGSLDDDGWLFLHGRKKELINQGGEKISPDEVEDVLRTLAGVREVSVFARAHPRLGEQVAAAVVVDENAPDDDTWLDACVGRLAHHQMPRTFFRVTSLPRGPTGKVLRRVLQQQFSAEAEAT
jgi:acyl-CoA synthetase (AMP-forming)/AMP-acid ligase II